MITDAPVMRQEVTNSTLLHVAPDNMGVRACQHFNDLTLWSPLIDMTRLSYQHLSLIHI